MLELVMFDADGVLFDSEESNIAYYNAIFAGLGEPPMSHEEELAGVFMSANQIFEARASGDQARVARMQEIGRTLDFTPFFDLLRPSLELRPFLLALKKDFRLGLATNRAATVAKLLEHLRLSGVFDAVASARDKVRPKPAPDMLLLCAERAGTSPSRAVYVGDSSIDLAAAQAAGIDFLGVGPRVEHDVWVSTLNEVPQALRERFCNGAGN